MKLAASDAKNTAALATSCGSPMRRRWVWLKKRLSRSGSCCSDAVASVLMSPGWIATTRMPSGPHARAKLSGERFEPSLDRPVDPQAAHGGGRADVDDHAPARGPHIRPRPLGGEHGRPQVHVDETFEFFDRNVRGRVAAVDGCVVDQHVQPAQGGMSAVDQFKHGITSSRSTTIGYATASCSRTSAATACSFRALVAAMATSAPASANARAILRPTPRLAPVMSARRPESEKASRTASSSRSVRRQRQARCR